MSNYIPLPPQGLTSTSNSIAAETSFEPCAATASLFLYTEGSVVICLHHDSLAVERLFEKHTEDIQFICVDNVSERGAGRLVVTYDVGKTAIVWDLFTGEQISRFASYEPLTVAAWMRNGNLAFGNEKGEVILFEPATSEHVSARTIFDPITAIAPSADCRTYAIGYRNGSILLASLQPQFTILHTLSTSRAPSSIAALTWHASSSKQKSDMLATHTIDGDLRVWSVAKPPTNSNPRVIRALRRSETFTPSKSWISWSKNGRILQYSDGEIWAWDVRTKDVKHELILAGGELRGLAAYGATGTLFTLGPDHSIQQYDVDHAAMVANISRASSSLPQTPSQEMSQPSFTSESETEMTPNSQSRLDAYAAEAARLEKTRATTPLSNQDRLDSRTTQTFSPVSKTERTSTSVSHGAQPIVPREIYSPVSNKSERKTSRLRQEVIMSPEERPIPDLFPFTRARLSDMPYKQPRISDDSHTTPDILRQQMLSVVFGWDGDVYALVNAELGRLPTESSHAVFLTKWLGHSTDHLARIIASPTSDPTLNWMRLALSAITDSADSKKVAQVLVEQMLTRGDVHAAATLLISCGDYDDAVEVYVSRNHHMEAVLLTCLLMPTEWQRLSFLVRKWGEHVVQNNEHALAVRCFSCIGMEPSEPWTSPEAQLPVTVEVQPPTLQLQPSIYHKTMERRSIHDGGMVSPPQASPVGAEIPIPPVSPRNALQMSGLKLVTSFGGQDHYKFPGLMSDEGTPINAALITPIAESAAPRSALSPGGLSSYRANNMRSLNAALSSKPSTPGGMHRNRLPSIGETVDDSETSGYASMMPPRAPPTPADSGSDKEREKALQATLDPVKFREELPVLLTPARYEPPGFPAGQTPQTAISTRPPISYPESLSSEGSALKRTTSRSRKPDGLSLRMFATQDDEPKLEQQMTQTYGENLKRPATTDSVNSMENPDFTSPPHTGNSLNSGRSMKSPSITGRSLDQFMSSLDQARSYKARVRGNSVSSKQSRDEVSERKRHRQRDHSIEVSTRQYDGKSVPAPKRSPSSPVPMSPGELGLYAAASIESLDSAAFNQSSTSRQPTPAQSNGRERRTSNAATGERSKHRSRSRQPEGKSRAGSRATSRRRSPEDRSGRGRSKSRREDAAVRSPSSPEPLQFSEDDPTSASSIDPALRIVSQNRHRLHSQSNRRSDRSMSAQRHQSPDRKSHRVRSRSRQQDSIEYTLNGKIGGNARGDYSRRRAESSSAIVREVVDELPTFEGDRPQSSQEGIQLSLSNTRYVEPSRRTRQLAQAELEARRLSLQRRPSAPAIPFPGQEHIHNKSLSIDYAPPLVRAYTDTNTLTLGSMSANPTLSELNAHMRSRPTTPRAMKHPNHSRNTSVPELPNVGNILNNDMGRIPKVQTYASPSPNLRGESFTSPEVPFDMPKHPAFDSNISTSRPSSRNVASHRHPSPARAPSRDRARTAPRDIQVVTIGEEDWQPSATLSGPPPLVPELQHLAIPPPPPPPPAPPKEYLANGLRIHTDMNLAQSIPLPPSAYQHEGMSALSIMSPTSASDARHRRGRSSAENQIVGKIRTFAGRMRSNSRGRSTSRTRDNPTRSPPIGSDEAYSPYESLPNATQQAHQQLATVIEG